MGQHRRSKPLIVAIWLVTLYLLIGIPLDIIKLIGMRESVEDGIRAKKHNSSKYASYTDVPVVHVPHVDCRIIFSARENRETAIGQFYQRYRNGSSSMSAGELIQQTTDCSGFLEDRRYLRRPVSEEESSFSIAFSILVYKDPGQAERLLRAIYRTSNYYCIHVDTKSPPEVKQAMLQLARCLPNVHIATRMYNVTWGFISVVEPEISCMQTLWPFKRWKYFINLTGQEFPLKTNLELVRILSIYNGTNDVPGVALKILESRFIDWVRYQHLPNHPNGLPPNRTKKEPFPLWLNFTKGSAHVTLSRAFVEFVLYNPLSLQLFQWMRDTFVPDETYLSTLSHNPRFKAPGGYTGGSSLAAFTMSRYKMWRHLVPCRAFYQRNICIPGVGDLALMARAPSLFINKFEDTSQHLAYDCLEQLHFNRTRQDILSGANRLNLGYYRQLPFVKRSRRPIQTDEPEWLLSDSELDDWKAFTVIKREEEEAEEKEEQTDAGKDLNDDMDDDLVGLRQIANQRGKDKPLNSPDKQGNPVVDIAKKPKPKKKSKHNVEAAMRLKNAKNMKKRIT